MKKRVVFLVGPTGIGKTEVALALAKRLNAEIISCDSMQIYKGMDIITSKPSAVLRKRIPHHALGVVSSTKEYNVSQYRRRAWRAIQEILKKHKIPLVVGGTGLYMSVLIDGIFKEKAEDLRIRQRLYKQAERAGSGVLYDKLKLVDSLAASRIHPHDTKRIIRALEVFEVTGKPISQLQKQRKGLPDSYGVKIFGLAMDRESLFRRIERRVDRMFAQGLVDEVTRLLRKKLSKTASCAIGIRELRGYKEGRYDLAQARELIKRNTRRYARRQLTWFRKDKRICWVWVSESDTPAAIATRIAALAH